MKKVAADLVNPWCPGQLVAFRNGVVWMHHHEVVGWDSSRKDVVARYGFTGFVAPGADGEFIGWNDEELYRLDERGQVLVRGALPADPLGRPMAPSPVGLGVVLFDGHLQRMDESGEWRAVGPNTRVVSAIATRDIVVGADWRTGVFGVHVATGETVFSHPATVFGDRALDGLPVDADEEMTAAEAERYALDSVALGLYAGYGGVLVTDPRPRATRVLPLRLTNGGDGTPFEVPGYVGDGAQLAASDELALFIPGNDEGRLIWVRHQNGETWSLTLSSDLPQPRPLAGDGFVGYAMEGEGVDGRGRLGVITYVDGSFHHHMLALPEGCTVPAFTQLTVEGSKVVLANSPGFVHIDVSPLLDRAPEPTMLVVSEVRGEPPNRLRGEVTFVGRTVSFVVVTTNETGKVKVSADGLRGAQVGDPVIIEDVQSDGQGGWLVGACYPEGRPPAPKTRKLRPPTPA